MVQYGCGPPFGNLRASRTPVHFMLVFTKKSARHLTPANTVIKNWLKTVKTIIINNLLNIIMFHCFIYFYTPTIYFNLFLDSILG